ncbi:MAG TPA: hypothetical protein VFQ92_21255, partial [Blastocatellia bacterium]|nr:hypothetical protein [Blastocatellia bacterium]
MKSGRRKSLDGVIKVFTLFLVFAAFLVTPYYSGHTESVSKIQSVEMPGLTGAANNVIYIDDRYVLAAPYAPSNIEAEEPEDGLDLEKLDNHYLYLIDTKKPNNKLNPADLKTCYFPSRVLYDAATRTVFVRGTEFYKNESGEDASREVIVHVHLNLDTDGKPYFEPDAPVPIPIEGHKTSFSEDAPA